MCTFPDLMTASPFRLSPPSPSSSLYLLPSSLRNPARLFLAATGFTDFTTHTIESHDVGGLPEGKSTNPLLRYLRLRVPLEVRVQSPQHPFSFSLFFASLDIEALPFERTGHPDLRLTNGRALTFSQISQVGFVVTVEPGAYFNRHLLTPYQNSPFIDHAKVEEYMYVGGVRIEDNLLVTADGYDNFTSIPKTVAEVEAITARK